MARFYKTPDGREYPLFEAEYDMAVKVYKSDRRRAKIGDPEGCFIALGVKRHPDVLDVYIGSGQDVYVIFKANGAMPEHARHFTLPKLAAKVRDRFDTKGAPSTQVLVLRKPTPSRTLECRAEQNKRRRAEVKAGSPVTKRGTQNRSRFVRLGVAHRPRARLVKNMVEIIPVAQESS